MPVGVFIEIDIENCVLRRSDIVNQISNLLLVMSFLFGKVIDNKTY